jgi:HAD superfamily hydrolase (TIGR01509 family)
MDGIQAVILDLDRLMVESEPLSLKAWQQFLTEYGYDLEEEAYREFIGKDERIAIEILRRSMDLPVSDEEIIDGHYDYWKIILQEEAVPMEGLLPFINVIQDRGLKMGVASNSRSDYVHCMLETIGLDGFFQCVRTFDMVPRGKPDPDVYQAVAECLKVEPRNCLGIEDSPAGLQSAINAGMRCAVIPNSSLQDAPFDGAYAIFPSFVELSANLDWVLS